MNTEVTPPLASKPLVSVVTVCLNAGEHLRTAMRSVLTQSYSSIDYVVIDGGSTDDTLDIIREFEPLFAGRMRWISEPDAGLYDAMNKGVRMASGDLLGIMNADDAFEPDAVSQAVSTWLAHPGAGVVYGDTCNIDATGEVTLVRPAPAVVTEQVMMGGMLLCHQSMFVTGATYRELGLYDTNYHILADYEFVMRCLRAGVEFANTHTNLSFFRLGGVSGSFDRKLDRELTQIRIAYGAKPLAQWALYYKHAVSLVAYGALKHIPAFRNAYEKRRNRTPEL